MPAANIIACISPLYFFFFHSAGYHPVFFNLLYSSPYSSPAYKNLHGDLDVFGDIVNIVNFASAFFHSFFRSFSSSNGNVGKANLSKSDSNSRS